MPVGTRNGPRIELAVRCGGCRHLDTEKSYGSNDYEEIDYVCIADGGKKYLPSSADFTPPWCPLMPPDVAEWQAAVKRLTDA